MGSNLVVVAIPTADDRVWKVSSEKVPHLTMLFLGENANVPNLERIVEFVQHAVDASEHGSFMLEVDYRGLLGPDNADVLHFRKDWSFQWVNSFRNQLLQQPDIRSAYESVEQYPEWRPHLTLGYPETPAKNDDLEYGINWVSFDRIAIWTGDFEGPEFRLRWPERAMDTVAYSDTAKRGAEVLEHYGVKGMRWGVRNASETKKGMFDPEGHDLTTDVVKVGVGVIVPIAAPFSIPAQVRLARAGVRGAKAKAVDKEEQKFAKKAMTQKNFVEIHNRSVDRFNRDIKGLNEKHTGDLTKPGKERDAYDKDVQKLLQDSYREAANSIGNKRSTMHLDLEFKNDGYDFKISAKEGAPTPLPKRVEHAATTEDDIETFTGKIKRDATGHIVGFEFDDFKPKTVAHTAELGEAFLEHYGVKGMRWGTRKNNSLSAHLQEAQTKREADRRENRSPKPVEVHDTIGLTSRSKTKIKTKGGEDHPAAEDAIKVAEVKAKLKKSGPAALSNQELQDLQTRLNLERNVTQLVSSTARVKKGRQFVKDLTGFNKDVNDTVNTGLQTARLSKQFR